MMTQQLGFSILTAPLAAIDRRGLSQAWYSALHLAREAAHPPAQAMPRTPVSCRTGLRIADTSASGRRTSAVPALSRHASAPERARMAEQDRRAPRSPLARKIERCFLDPARRAHRATFTIEGSSARVHVALQRAGAAMRLVAVCPPAVRERVKCALEEARYALAVRGIALDLAVNGEPA